MHYKIPVYMSTGSFKAFSWFHLLHMRKAWRNPLVFFLIFFISSILCYIQYPSDGAIMLGTLLLAIAIILPFLYFFKYARSLKKQATLYKLDSKPLMYTIFINEDHIHVESGDELADYPYDIIFKVFRHKQNVYVYITPARAFILPLEEGKYTADEVIQMLRQKLGPEKIKVKE